MGIPSKLGMLGLYPGSSQYPSSPVSPLKSPNHPPRNAYLRSAFTYLPIRVYYVFYFSLRKICFFEKEFLHLLVEEQHNVVREADYLKTN